MARRRRVLRTTSDSDKDVDFRRAKMGLGRLLVRRALNGRERAGKRRAPSHHHAVLDKP